MVQRKQSDFTWNTEKMEAIFASSLQILKSIQTQFKSEDLENKEWSEEDHAKFWQDFDNISTILKHEINKLALLVDVNDSRKKPPESDVEKLCKSVEQACVTLWSTYLRLTPQAGRTFCASVAETCQVMIQSTFQLLTKLSKCSKRQDALQSVAEVWEKCDKIKNTVPRNNVQAVCQALQEQRNLVQDALAELEEAKTNMATDMDDDDEKWSETELTILPPALGLLKSAQALLKKIQMSLKQNGQSFVSESINEMDDILVHCQKISPLVDDLAMPLYPPMALEEIETQSNALSQEVKALIQKLEAIHFVLKKDYEQWGSFLVKAIDHNMSKLEVALAQSKTESLNLESK